jgi:predicted porin
MKKTLLALAVMTAAGSANAAIEIYNENGVSVGLSGDIEVVYSNTLTSSSMEQKIEDADFGFDVRYMVNDDWTVGAYWSFDGSDGTNAEVTENGDTYVAAYHKTFGSIKFGRLCTAVDDLGIGADEAFGISTMLDNNTYECGDEGIRYDIDTGDVYATLGFIQNKTQSRNVVLTEDSNGNQDGFGDINKKVEGNNDDYMDVRAGYRGLEGFDISVFASQTKADEANSDFGGYGSELVFSGIENVYLAAAYYATTADAANSDNTVIAFAAGYTMDLWGFNTGYSIGDHDNNAEDKDLWFVNTTYAVAPNTKIYAEVGGSDETDSNTGLALGVEASF